jgi:peptidyl-prolyl cis-trans isomerase C
MRVVNLCVVIFVSTAVLLSGCSKKQSRALAKVGKRTITVEQLENRLAGKKFSSWDQELTQREEALQNLIDEELMTLGAIEAGMDDDPDFKAKTEELERSVLLQTLYEVEIVEKSQPSDKELKETYEKMSWEVKASHILVETEEEAQEIINQLSEGADFGELASEKSIDPRSKTKNGDLGYFGWGRMVSPFQDTAWAMQPGTISMPVQTQFGWHIIKLEDRRKSRLKSFEEEKDRLRGTLTNQKAKQLSEEYLTKLKEKANIQMDPEATQVVLNKFMAQKMAPEDFTEEEKQMGFVTYQGGAWNVDTFLREAEKVPPMYRPRIKKLENLEVFVENLLTSILLDDVARKKGLDKKKDVVEKIRSERDRILVKLFLEKGVPADTTVTEEQIEAYYQEHIDRYTEPEQIRVWDIQLQTREEAEEILKQIRAGANFDKIAREKTLRIWSREKNGDLGYIDVNHYPNIAAAALEMRPGEIGGPIKDNDSDKHSIIKVGDKKPSQAKPLEGLKNGIRNNILRIRKDEAGKLRLDELRQKHGVETFTKVLESTVTTPKEEAA